MPLDGLRQLTAALNSSVDMEGYRYCQHLKNEGNACRGKRTVNGLKAMGEGVSNYVRITRNLTINSDIYYVIIIPFKVRNIFPKILRFGFKTAIN
jgi:hypothetical protein